MNVMYVSTALICFFKFSKVIQFLYHLGVYLEVIFRTDTVSLSDNFNLGYSLSKLSEFLV